MKISHDEDWYIDRRKLRAAASTIGVMLILFLAFIRVAYVLIIIVLNFILNRTFPLSLSEFQKAGFFLFEHIPNFDMIINGLVQIVSLAMTVCIVSIFYKFKPLEILMPKKDSSMLFENEQVFLNDVPVKKKKYGAKLILIAFPIIIMINYVTSIIIAAVTYLIERMGISVPKVDFKFDNLQPQTLIVYFLALCVFAPFIEEFLFRGCIIKILKPFGNWVAVIVSSLFFALLHGNIGQAFGAFFIGILFGFVAVKTESIVPAIILHSLNNFYMFSATVVSNFPNNYILLSIFGFVGLTLFGFGVFHTIKHAKKFTLESNNATCLSKKKIYATFFLNIFILIYIGLEIYAFFSF